MDKIEALKKLEEQVQNCIDCSLWLTRNKIVFGERNLDADIMVIGEAPGQTEDQEGKPFCGRAGVLLNKWFEYIHLNRKDVYILNIIKCRPPNNRDPQPSEVQSCISYLHNQILIIQPKVIILLGAVALKSLFQDNTLGIMKNRGIWREYQNISVMPMYHPAFLLRQGSEINKNKVKNDLNLIVEKLKKC